MKTKLHNDYSEQILKAIGWSIFMGSLFYMDVLYAAPAKFSNLPTLDLVLDRIRTNIPSLMQLVTAFAYILGLYYVIDGVMELKHFAQMRTMMSSEHGLKKPLIKLFIGGFLIYLPSAIQTGMETLWEQPYPSAYLTDTTTSSAWQLVVNNSFTILQLIGVIAFIRGLVILTHLGGHGGQPGTFWRGLTHIIGGILCINMYDTVRMIGATLGLTGIMNDLN